MNQSVVTSEAIQYTCSKFGMWITSIPFTAVNQDYELEEPLFSKAALLKLCVASNLLVACSC